MLLFLINGKGLPITLCLLAFFAIPRNAEASPSQTNLTMQSGFVRFDNILIPEVDPSINPGTTTAQQGIPLAIGVGARTQLSLLRYDLGFSYLRAMTMLGKTPGQKSTPGFARMALDQYVDAHLGANIFSGVGLVLNRNQFSDGSYIHSLDAIHIGARFAWEPSSRSRLGIGVYKSLVAKFGFADKSSLVMNGIPGAKADSYGARLHGSYEFGQNSSLDLGFQSESTLVQYPHKMIYDRYGFAVAESSPETRKIKLNTSTFLLGIGKQF
jgi:hypothetical protein